METKHTPLPWVVDGAFDLSECDDFGKQTLLIRSGRNDVAYVANNSDKEMKNADARLISTAPEMLAELERLAESFGWPSDHPACILIAKAKGE